MATLNIISISTRHSFSGHQHFIQYNKFCAQAQRHANRRSSQTKDSLSVVTKRYSSLWSLSIVRLRTTLPTYHKHNIVSYSYLVYLRNLPSHNGMLFDCLHIFFDSTSVVPIFALHLNLFSTS